MIDLKSRNWKPFRIGDLFDVKGTVTTKLEDLETTNTGQYPYITTQDINNGVAC